MAEPDPKSMLLELIREVAEGEGDIGDMRQWLPPLTAFAEEFAAPGFECWMQGLPPTPPLRHPGVEGLAAGWDDYAEAFESVRAELEAVHESETGVAILVNQLVRTRTGGVEMAQRSAMVFVFDDRRLARVELHLDQDAALRAAGIEPAS